MNEMNGNKRYTSNYGRTSRSPVRRYTQKRSLSRSPEANARYFNRGDKMNPEPNNCIGIFGLSTRTTEEDLSELFEKYGKIISIQLVTDRITNESRGFCFINYENIDAATRAIEKANGTEIDGRPVRIDYSLTKRPHKPTPGQYLGKETRYRPDERGYEDRRKKSMSPAPYRGRSPPRRQRSPPPMYMNRDRGYGSPPGRQRSPHPRGFMNAGNRTRSPQYRDRSPVYRQRSPPRGQRSPPPRGYVNPQYRQRSPPRGQRSPPRGQRSPPRGQRSPPRGQRSPPRGQRSPYREARPRFNDYF